MVLVLSMQAEQGQDRHDHHDESDQINNAVHRSLPEFGQISERARLTRARQFDGEIAAAAASAAFAEAAAQQCCTNEDHENGADQYTENAGRAAAAVSHACLHLLWRDGNSGETDKFHRLRKSEIVAIAPGWR
jgi:hypothetical protein